VGTPGFRVVRVRLVAITANGEINDYEADPFFSTTNNYHKEKGADGI
jgi:hypothetical protein